MSRRPKEKCGRGRVGWLGRYICRVSTDPDVCRKLIKGRATLGKGRKECCTSPTEQDFSARREIRKHFHSREKNCTNVPRRNESRMHCLVAADHRHCLKRFFRFASAASSEYYFLNVFAERWEEGKENSQRARNFAARSRLSRHPCRFKIKRLLEKLPGNNKNFDQRGNIGEHLARAARPKR